MKPKEGIVASKVGDEYVLVATGPAEKDFHGIVRLNDTGGFIWNAIAEGLDEQQIAKRLTEEYQGVDFDGALKAVRDFVARLADANFLV